MSAQPGGLPARWWSAVKPQSWPKMLVAAMFGQALGVAAAGAFSWRGAVVGLVFSLCDLIYLVLLNDWGDREVDAVKRRMFPYSCSPKTIPDGLLPATHLLIVGVTAAIIGLLVAVVGGWWLPRRWLGPAAALCLIVYHAYTFAPFRLNYRGGGEVLEMLGVGALLPWFNAYAQSGVLSHDVFWVLPGFALFSLASALASGLSDEESDRSGGKCTFTTMFGNARVRWFTELLLVLGALAWCVASVRYPEAARWWAVVPAVGVVLWFGWQVRQISAQAVTNAFAAQGIYKRRLHYAVWCGTLVFICLLIVVP